ncbi:hypothetical protein [Streptomyces sp. NPDC048106]|uniref:hypothetical protein n=1 Tax=Streptomyces sp. NPDC048106 TaxID=3155750 RepID=UPI003456E530
MRRARPHRDEDPEDRGTAVGLEETTRIVDALPRLEIRPARERDAGRDRPDGPVGV